MDRNKTEEDMPIGLDWLRLAHPGRRFHGGLVQLVSQG
jgi:hypothetical protein